MVQAVDRQRLQSSSAVGGSVGESFWGLKCRHPHNVGLGVVSGAGRFITFRGGARWRGHADDSGGDVGLVTV